jgi:catechol 2,3-dioxygenase-like lactoylglutathione lyase family enzyme
MTLRCIIHINIRVPPAKLEACRSFYCDVLGLEVGPRPPFKSVGYWLYADGSPVVHLVADAAAAAGPSCLSHAAFECTDLKGALEVLNARQIAYRFSTVPTLDVLQVNLTDPAGVGIELSFEGERDSVGLSAPPDTSGR